VARLLGLGFLLPNWVYFGNFGQFRELGKEREGKKLRKGLKKFLRKERG